MTSLINLLLMPSSIPMTAPRQTSSPANALVSLVWVRLISWVSQELWRLAATTGLRRGRKALRFHPIFDEKPKIVSHEDHLPPKSRAAIIRLRLGSATTNKHLHVIGVRNDPWCQSCRVIDNEWHRILQCPASVAVWHACLSGGDCVVSQSHGGNESTSQFTKLFHTTFSQPIHEKN
jgi:hypothetical protein